MALGHSGLTDIPSYMCNGCNSITNITFPNGIISVGDRAFNGCAGLTSVTFNGKPNTIGKYTFYNCPNLTSISVYWEEGEVANAPWGATNATIKYGEKRKCNYIN